MTTQRITDPLLLAGRVLALLGQGLMVVLGIIGTLVISVYLFANRIIVEELATEFPGMDPTNFGAALLTLMAILIAFAVIGFFFLDRLRNIIGTVEEGDPFVPANGDRLTTMGWLALGGQVLAIPAAGAGLYMMKLLDAAAHENVTSDFSYDPSGLLLVVTLFILARVFKQGAAMREDLEGTV